MAITPRMPDTAHRTPFAWPRRTHPPFDLQRSAAPFACAAAEVQEHSDAVSVGLRGNFLEAISSGLQASCRPYCSGHPVHAVLRAARRCAREEENEISGRHDDAIARRPQHRAGTDLLV